jgi:hypothetical protein
MINDRIVKHYGYESNEDPRNKVRVALTEKGRIILRFERVALRKRVRKTEKPRNKQLPIGFRRSRRGSVLISNVPMSKERALMLQMLLNKLFPL